MATFSVRAHDRQDEKVEAEWHAVNGQGCLVLGNGEDERVATYANGHWASVVQEKPTPVDKGALVNDGWLKPGQVAANLNYKAEPVLTFEQWRDLAAKRGEQ